MMRLLFFALLAFVAFKIWTSVKRRLPSHGRPPEKTRRGEDMVQDPHCGVYLPRGDALTETVGGKRRYFCSEKCRNAFAGRK